MTDFDSALMHVEAPGLPVMEHLGYLCRVPVDGSATGGVFSLVEERGQLGCMSPRHLHDRESETFIVLDGALEGWCDGKTQLVEAGGVLHLPARREHAFRVASDIRRIQPVVATPLIPEVVNDGDGGLEQEDQRRARGCAPAVACGSGASAGDALARAA